jgi:hypothetical protein
MSDNVAMKWFRSNIRHGVRLALFALSTQLVLAFGHCHAVGLPHDTTLSSFPWSHSVAIDQTPSRHASSHEQPSDDDSDRARDVCAICAVLAMAETMLAAPPPQPSPLPEAVEFFYERIDAPLILPTARRGFFESRAPPAS